MMLAFDGGMSNETWKYLAMNVTNPVEMLCSITITRLILNQVLLWNISNTRFGNAANKGKIKFYFQFLTIYICRLSNLLMKLSWFNQYQFGIE